MLKIQDWAVTWAVSLARGWGAKPGTSPPLLGAGYPTHCDHVASSPGMHTPNTSKSQTPSGVSATLPPQRNGMGSWLRKLTTLLTFSELANTVPGVLGRHVHNSFSKFLAPAQVWKWPILSLILNKDRERKKVTEQEKMKILLLTATHLLITFWAKRHYFPCTIRWITCTVYYTVIIVIPQFTDEKREAQQD